MRPCKWVYLGQAEGEKSPVIDRFCEVDDFGQQVGSSFAFKKLKTVFLPGGVYEVPDGDAPTFGVNEIKFTGKMVLNDTWLNEIRTEHQVFLANKKLKGLEKKFKTEYKLSNNLATLAIEYRKLYGVDRMLFEHLVIAKLRELAGKA